MRGEPWRRGRRRARTPAAQICPNFRISGIGGRVCDAASRGRLRGCIGQISPGLPLLEVVAYCAKAAALEDPRFVRSSPEELAEIEIEISVLSRLEDDLARVRFEPANTA